MRFFSRRATEFKGCGRFRLTILTLIYYLLRSRHNDRVESLWLRISVRRFDIEQLSSCKYDFSRRRKFKLD